MAARLFDGTGAPSHIGSGPARAASAELGLLHRHAFEDAESDGRRHEVPQLKTR